jgi:hypothetical protein
MRGYGLPKNPAERLYVMCLAIIGTEVSSDENTHIVSLPTASGTMEDSVPVTDALMATSLVSQVQRVGEKEQ